jgi:hypothetical protein
MRKCPKGWANCGRCHRSKFKSNAHGPDQAIRPLLPGAHGEAIEVREEWHRKREEILAYPDQRPDLVRVLERDRQAAEARARRKVRRRRIEHDALHEFASLIGALERWVDETEGELQAEMRARLKLARRVQDKIETLDRETQLARAAELREESRA